MISVAAWGWEGEGEGGWGWGSAAGEGSGMSIGGWGWGWEWGWGGRQGWEGMGVSDEEGEGGGVAVEVVAMADGSDFAVAEEAGEGELAAEMFVDEAGIVVAMAEESLAAAGAAAEAGGEDGLVGEADAGLVEEGGEVVGGGFAVAELELDGLADADAGADGDDAAVGVGAEEVADEEIAAAMFLEVFVDGEADEDVAVGAGFFGFGEGVEGVLEDGEGWEVTDALDEVAIGGGDGPGAADGGAALGDDGFKADVAGDGDGDGAVGESLLVEKEAGGVGVGGVAGEAADGGGAGVGVVPLGEPTFGVEFAGVGEDEPTAGGVGGDPGKVVPVGGFLGGLEVVGGEAHRGELGAGEGEEEDGEGGAFLDFLGLADDAVGAAAGEEGGVGVDLDQFVDLADLGEEGGAGEDEGEVGAAAGELEAGVFEAGPEGILVERIDEEEGGGVAGDRHGDGGRGCAPAREGAGGGEGWWEVVGWRIRRPSVWG